MSNNAEQVNVDAQEAPKAKARGGKKNVTANVTTDVVASASTSDANAPSLTTLLEIIEELKTRVATLEGTVKTLQTTCNTKPTNDAPSKPAKSTEEKKPRAPTAYNLFMKEKMSELKENHPEMSNIDRMKMAAEAWTESKK